jgi:hypothetical protein
MDRVTAAGGLGAASQASASEIAVAAAANEFFSAFAVAEGTEADAFAVVGEDFGQATGETESTGTSAAGDHSKAVVEAAVNEASPAPSNTVASEDQGGVAPSGGAAASPAGAAPMIYPDFSRGTPTKRAPAPELSRLFLLQ